MPTCLFCKREIDAGNDGGDIVDDAYICRDCNNLDSDDWDDEDACESFDAVNEAAHAG